MAPQQLRKPTPAEPPRPRTTIPPPANDNRHARRVLLLVGAAAIAAGLLAYALIRLVG